MTTSGKSSKFGFLSSLIPSPLKHKASPKKDSASDNVIHDRHLGDAGSGKPLVCTKEGYKVTLKNQGETASGKCEWSQQLRDKAKEELEQIEREQPRANKSLKNLYAIPKKDSKAEKIRKDQEELMQLVQEAEKTGNVKKTRRHSVTSAKELKEMQDMSELLDMVKSAQSNGHVKVMRRKSTTTVPITGAGKITLGAAH